MSNLTAWVKNVGSKKAVDITRPVCQQFKGSQQKFVIQRKTKQQENP